MFKNILTAILFLLCGASIYMNIKNTRQIEKLQKDIEISLAASDIEIPENVQELGENIISFYNTIFGEANEFMTGALGKDNNIGVSSSYRIEDRYVLGNIITPEISGKYTGKITIDIIVNQIGNVIKTRVNPSATTIQNENTIEEARKAALKTNFNTSFDAPKQQNGKITYVYTMK